MDSTAQTAPRESEIINELVSRVTPGFDSANSPYGFINLQQTGVTGDAWIRQPKQLLGTQKSSTKLLARVTQGFDIGNSPMASEIIKELLARVKHGFDSPNNP
jgi:phosphosulfolactate phosphohydrolase-like enzyme